MRFMNGTTARYAVWTVLLLGLAGLGLYRQFALSAMPAASSVAIPEGARSIVFGMGCFWGAEKRMSALPGVVNVVSGYAGGDYADPTYRRILSAEYAEDTRNHAEVVQVMFDPEVTSARQLLIGFWENHDPTQGDRQGNDVGSNYRSAVYYTSESQREAVISTRDTYQEALHEAGFGDITTEIAALERFYPAEEYHQDYLKKNPRGYCGLGGTGVAFPGSSQSMGVESSMQPLDPATLSRDRQLIVFESQDCPFCRLFNQQVVSQWQSDIPLASSLSSRPPEGWTLASALRATPTVVLFRDGREVSRHTGYDGRQKAFWRWLNQAL